MKVEHEKTDEKLTSSDQTNQIESNAAPTKVPFDISAYKNETTGNENKLPVLHTNASSGFKTTTNTKSTGKKYITIKDGGLLVKHADGNTATLSQLHKEMNTGDKHSIHCIDPNHDDNNASGLIQKYKSGDLLCTCLGCGVNSWFRDDKNNEVTVKQVKEEVITLPLTGNPTINLFDKYGKKKKPSRLLIEMGRLNHLFHDANDNGFIVAEIKGAKYTYYIKSNDFVDYLLRLHYFSTDEGISDNAIKTAQGALNSQAKFDSPLEETGIRVVNQDSYTLIDICDEARRVLKVDETGVNYIKDSPVNFLKMKGMKPLPEYIESQDIKEGIMLLRKYLPDSEEAFSLIFAFLCCSLAGTTTQPILVIQGPEGCEKSTITRVCRSFYDDSSTPLRSPSGGLENLINDAENSYGMTLDNLSYIDIKLSNMLCKFATGIGFTKRQLWTDNGIHLINLKRPVIINGITYLGTQPDFISRAFIVDLPTMPPSERRSDEAFWADFEKDKPAIFSALLGALVSGYQHKKDIEVDYKTRLLGETEWVTACERNLGMEGNFIKAYKANHERANQNNIDSCPIGNAIQIFMSTRNEYIGTTTDLLKALTNNTDLSQTQSREWPKTLKKLTSMVKKQESSLEKIGINITKDDFDKREYVIVNTKFKQEKGASIFGNGSDDDNSESSSDLPDWIKK